jgi:hypothetical protein
MTSFKLAFILWARDTVIGMVAVAGWPRWPWAHRAVDRLEIMSESLREHVKARA